MSDIAAGDVAYVVQQTSKLEDGRRRSVVKISVGDGALLYPSGGIPLSGLSAAGFPNAISEVHLIDANDASGYVFKINYESNKLRIYQAPARTHGHDFTITKGAITASTELGLSADATSATINNNAIAATRVLAKATGPVASETLAAAVLVELGNVAVAAQVLYATVIGY